MGACCDTLLKPSKPPLSSKGLYVARVSKSSDDLPKLLLNPPHPYNPRYVEVWLTYGDL